MKISTKWIKRVFALSLVVLLSIDSSGAVLSDNDGAAFISRPEFDSMINAFYSDLEDIETKVDSKIGDIVAKYVASVIPRDDPTNYYGNLKRVIGNKNPFFLNSASSGTSTLTTDIVVNKRKNYSTKYIQKTTTADNIAVGYATITWSPPDDGNWVYGYLTLMNASETILTTVDLRDPGYREPNYEWAIPIWETTTVTVRMQEASGYPAWYKDYVCGPGDTLDIETIKTDEGRTSREWRVCVFQNELPPNYAALLKRKTNEVEKVEYGGDGNAYGLGLGLGITVSSSAGKAKPSSSTTTEETFELNNVISGNASRSGSGSQWTYQLNPDGSKTLKRYWSTFYPQQNIKLNYKTFKDYGTKTTAVAANDLKDDNACTYEPSITPAWGSVSVGTDNTSYSTTNKVGYCEEVFAIVKESDDTTDYRIAQWGNNASSNIYASAETPLLVNTTTNLNTWTDLAASSVTIAGVTHTTTKVTNNVKEVKVNPETLALNTFVNSYYTGIAGETVNLGYGIPIMMTNADNSVRYTITIPVKQTVAPAGTTVASGNVTARLSLNHFVNGSFATPSDRVWEGTISCDSSGVGSATFTVTGIPKGRQLWLNLYGDTAYRKVELTGFNVVMS